MNEYLSVEEISSMLQINPKTIRRHIRDGKLKAVKVGSQWRVKREDLNSYMDSREIIKEQKKEWEDSLKDFVSGKHIEIEGKIQVCTIIDFYPDTLDEQKSITHALIDMMGSNDTDQKEARFKYYMVDERKARFIIWGNPKFSATMLNAVANVL
ncbi:MAG: helix-turn-helix domain-containing protein [Armatimonadota bacterium]